MRITPFNKKESDPISERARALSQEIAALEAQIKKLDSKLATGPPPPKLRSTAMPHGATTFIHSPQSQAIAPATTSRNEPIFEEVDQARLKAKDDAVAEDEHHQHYNDLGVRKYDLAAFVRRIKNHFRGPSTANPKLVNYLAAGSIQGLRPMRYEKRVARNRFLLVVVVILAALIGIFKYLSRR